MNEEDLNRHIDDLLCEIQSGLDPVLIIRMMVDGRDQTVGEYLKLYEEFTGEPRHMSYLWRRLVDDDPKDTIETDCR